MGEYGQIGVTKDDGQLYLFMTSKSEGEKRVAVSDVPSFDASRVFLRIVFDFAGDDKAYFYYSADGESFVSIGDALNMQYTLDLFVGYRIGIFSYATKELDGMVDFRNLVFS